MKSPLNRIFTWEELILFGFLDFEPKVANSDITPLHSKSGKTPITYYDLFNLESMKENPFFFSFLEETYVKIKKDADNFNKKMVLETEPFLFSIPKTDHNRRILKVPNFYSYVLISGLLIENKDIILNDIENDKHSTSKYFGRLPYDFVTTDDIAENSYFGKQKILKVDFSNFYHTLYTHSIPWMHMGKAKAKAKRNGGLFNNLDLLIRSEQNGETHGLPTGNLVSRIVAEHFMSKFDACLDDDERFSDFVRYVDDISFGFNNEIDSIDFLERIRELARKYELNINESKVEEIKYEDNLVKENMLNFFNSKKINWQSKKNVQLLMRQFITIGLVDARSGKKGNDKLIFSGLRKLLLSIKKEPQKIDLLTHAICDGKYNSILQRLLDVAIKNAKLGIYFLNLYDELLVERGYQKSHDRVKRSFRRIMNQKINNIGNLLLLNNHKKFDQEVYNLLLFCEKAQVQLSYENYLSKLDMDKLDDFSLILWFVQSLRSYNHLDDDILEKIHNLFDKNFNASKDFTAQGNWLFRYEFYLFIQKKNLSYVIDNFYKRASNFSYEQLDFKKMYKKQSSSVKQHSSNFYRGMLMYEVGFTNIDWPI